MLKNEVLIIYCSESRTFCFVKEYTFGELCDVFIFSKFLIIISPEKNHYTDLWVPLFTRFCVKTVFSFFYWDFTSIN